jgi:hypothetical protein
VISFDGRGVEFEATDDDPRDFEAYTFRMRCWIMLQLLTLWTLRSIRWNGGMKSFDKDSVKN